MDIFFSFIQKLISSKRVRFIYRGNSNIFTDYNISCENLPLLSRYIFCLGDKSPYFFQNKPLNSICLFPLIWEKFNNKVSNLRFSNERTTKYVSKFMENNPEFIQYFSDNHNKYDFENLSQLPAKKREIIADYYLSILHTIGKSSNGKSYFLSSSKNYLVADEFKGDNSLIIYGWLPRKGIRNNIIKYVDTEKYSLFVKSLGLPVYQMPVYPKQKEICIKCGLLPHFIVGFQHNNKFYINPNTLNQWHDNIVYDGLDPNQEDFNDLYKATKLKQSFIFCDGEYYLISKMSITNI